MLVNADTDHAQTVKAKRRKGLHCYNPDGTTTTDDPSRPHQTPNKVADIKKLLEYDIV